MDIPSGYSPLAQIPLIMFPWTVFPCSFFPCSGGIVTQRKNLELKKNLTLEDTHLITLDWSNLDCLREEDAEDRVRWRSLIRCGDP